MDGIRSRDGLVAGVVLLLACLCACKGPGERAKPTTALERAVFFEERDQHGRPHAISSRSRGGQGVDFVADGATVDVDSKLLVRPDTRELGGPLDPRQVSSWIAEAQELEVRLRGLEASVGNKVTLLGAWQKLQAVPVPSRENSSQARAFQELLAGTPDAGAARDGELAQELEEAQRRLEGLRAQLQQIDEDKKVIEGRRLRIEAFLFTPELENPVQVHVRGYDELDVGRVKAIERPDQALTGQQQAKILASTAGISERLEAIGRLREEWRREAQEAANSVGQMLRGLAQEAESASVPAGAQDPKSTGAASPDPDTLSELANRWAGAAPGQRAELLEESRRLLDTMSSSSAAPPGEQNGKEAAAAAQELAARAQAARSALERLAATGAVEPPAVNLPEPGGLSIPLDAAVPGWVDLRTTKALPGDRLNVRVELVEGQERAEGGAEERVLATVTNTFSLEELGWHHSLEPSIVYATADQNQGADDDAGFTAAIHWMWSYGTRDQERDPKWSRLLGWGAGLHAVLLSFPPDNDPEVGLGVSLGLWDSRLLFGAGYNLFADGSEDGELYYFIGSSLIPLVQALDKEK